MRVKFAILAMVASAIYPINSLSAGYVSGNDLYRDCTAEKNDLTYYQTRARCSAYIVGAADGIDEERTMSGIAECVPSNVAIGQLRDIVVDYLKKNPQNRHYTGYSIVSVALISAFRCQQKHN